jgi:peptide/nickel transport system permease protein
MRTARAKGLREGFIVRSHAWRNALIPIVSVAIGWLIGIFSGSIMIENIFGLNGIGKVYFDALTANDYEIVLAMQMFYIFLALVGNILVDLAYGLVDPRVRVQQ